MDPNLTEERAAVPSRDLDVRERELIAVIRQLMQELHPQRAKTVDVRGSSRLERDLGIDSLGRTELILRIERRFHVQLAIAAVGEAETVGDLLRALEEVHPIGGLPTEMAAAAPLPSVPAALEARTLIEVLEWHAAQHPDRLHLTVLEDDSRPLAAMSYRALADAAREVANGLIERDVVPGDRVALMLPTSRDFFVAFFAILYAGAVPVPIYPPMRPSQLEEHLRRQASILRNAGARLLITVSEGQRVAALLKGQVESLNAVETVSGLSLGTSTLARLPAAQEGATALIQYTSGSTGDPKGVVLSHANLLANIRAMGQAMEASSADVFVSWLPLYHDMGLIGAWLGCLYFAAPLYVMSPLSFLVRPESWLRAIHRFRATLSGAPNFAFELCLNKIADESLQGLDLSSLRMVANGAEPVSVPTLRRFTERFSRYGFRPGAMAPVYGLAENSVGLAFPSAGRTPLIDRVDRESLTRRGIAAQAQPDDRHPIEIASCGAPLPRHEVRVVDELGLELGERREGRVEFRGPSATPGYFRNETKTRELFHGSWLDTGDRGYMAGGEIYITGRIKDIIIRAGRHIYPQEIEEAIAEIEGIRKGCVAVFGVTDHTSGTEKVVIVAETRESDPDARAALKTRAQEIASDIAGTPPDEVILAPPRTVPKTSSGKIRRSAAKELYEKGRIGLPQPAPWQQLLRLTFAGLGPQLSRFTIVVRGTLYATWWWLVMPLSMAAAWFAVMLLPRLNWRWRAMRGIARAALAAIGVRVTVKGLDRLPAGNAVFVFNHSSYMDVVVLAAVLPGEPAYIAKSEFAPKFFAGNFMRRLGILFVERYDTSTSLADTDHAISVARQGRNIVFFPEGSFTRRPGLSEFYLGAFKVAAEAGVPIVPGIIHGTRSMLRSGQWFPRRTPLGVTIENAIVPYGKDFASVLRLRDEARQAVLAGCGEPDLGELVKPPQPLRALFEGGDWQQYDRTSQ
ncbi:MAG TPA: AMP-binding protein [Hyphomicrobiales bacterium]|nr:AMP-binding protein [Hyphomicrobiales bacterium]